MSNKLMNFNKFASLDSDSDNENNNNDKTSNDITVNDKIKNEKPKVIEKSKVIEKQSKKILSNNQTPNNQISNNQSENKITNQISTDMTKYYKNTSKNNNKQKYTNYKNQNNFSYNSNLNLNFNPNMGMNMNMNMNMNNDVDIGLNQEFSIEREEKNNLSEEIGVPIGGISNTNGFTLVENKKRRERINAICVEKELEDNYKNLLMSNYYKILAHHSEDKSWDYNSYHNITTLKTWKDMGTFLNSLDKANGECKYTDFDLFFMKNEISPMWEDMENRNGSICSIKIDSIEESYEILKYLMINMANNTLLKFNINTWNTVNGISYSTKKLDNPNETYCIIIKLWFKMNILNYGSVEKILNEQMNKLIEHYSIKIKQIKPEY